MQCSQRLRRGFLLPKLVLLKLQHSGIKAGKAVRHAMKDLKERTIRGGLARMCAQAATFLLGIGSLMVLARLLDPKDFGLVGMVTAFTGVLGMFRDFGLSSASVQRVNVTEEQISTLFWINLGWWILGLLIAAMAPAIAAFYHEPRLFGVTLVLAAGFILNAAGVQHGAILQRHMRFTALAVINTVSAIVGTAIAIGGAKAGYGYWALVAMAVASPLTSTILVWLATAWVPGMPHRRTGIRSMMHYGGTLTLYGLIGYVATNLQNVLLGRFWGADAIGIYGRAYRLVNIPTESLNGVVGEVAFPALARIQDDPSRLKSYFLKGYSLVLALTLPITVACTLFVDDVIYVLSGTQMEGCRCHFTLAGADDLGVCDHQSFRLVAFFDRAGRAALENEFGHRTPPGAELYDGIALWA